MKILSQTNDTMVLKDSAWGQVVNGGIIFLVLVFVAYNFTSLFSVSAIVRGIQAGQFIGLLAPFLVVCFFAVSIWQILSAAWITITIDKTQGQISSMAKTLFGSKTRTMLISSVVRVQVDQSTRSSGKSRTRIYRPVLIATDGSEFPLANWSSGSSGFSVNGFGMPSSFSSKDSSVGTQIAQFLNVPFQAPPTLGQAIQAVEQYAEKYASAADPLQKMEVRKEVTPFVDATGQGPSAPSA